MPNRILREGILDSDAVNKLNWAAEVFYRRLFSIVDDFGRYDARPEMLRAKLYPMRLERVSLPDIVKWLTDCVEAGLVRCYEVLKKPYLEIVKFDQQVRIKKSKYPPPDETCVADAKQMLSTCMSESNPNPKPKFYLKIAREQLNKKPSEWLMEQKEEAMNVHMMQNYPDKKLQTVLDKVDSEYPHYDFDDHNHVFNSFKLVAKNLFRPKAVFNQMPDVKREIKNL